MGIRNGDSVDRDIVGKHLRDWGRRSNLSRPSLALAERAGVDESYVWKLIKGTQPFDVSFDLVDRMFCAMGRPGLWQQDPELNKLYERVVAEADRLHPLEAAA